NFNCDVFLFHFTTYLLYNQRLQVPACKHSTFYLLKTHSSTVKSESKLAVTRLLPDQYLSNSVIVFTTNLSFILSNMMKCGPRRPQVNYCDISNIQLRTKRTQPVVA